LSKLHSADDDAIAWLTSYGSNAHDNNNIDWVLYTHTGSMAYKRKRKEEMARWSTPHFTLPYQLIC